MMLRHTQKPEQDIRCLPLSRFTSLKQVLAFLTRLAAQRSLGSAISTLQCCGDSRHVQLHPPFYVGTDSNWGSHACQQVLLSTEPSPQAQYANL